MLGPDDKPAFDDPPAAFKTVLKNVPHGKLEMIEYDSKSVGTRRKMNVYTPPGYAADRKYPVLYLLHGIGGDETEWQRSCAPDAILDNLIADGKAVPMIVVMPNGRARKNDRAEGNIYAAAPAFAAFEQDLLRDVIPTIGVALFGRRRSRAPRPCRALDGRRPEPQFRSESSRHLRMGRRFLVGPQHAAARPARPRSGRGPREVEAALACVRKARWPDPNQPGRSRLSQRAQRAARLARSTPTATTRPSGPRTSTCSRNASSNDGGSRQSRSRADTPRRGAALGSPVGGGPSSV